MDIDLIQSNHSQAEWILRILCFLNDLSQAFLRSLSLKGQLTLDCIYIVQQIFAFNRIFHVMIHF